MKVNTELTKEDMEIIESNEKDTMDLLERLEKARQFKLGDYIVCSLINNETKQRMPLTNSYNVNRKFKVVHVDKAGIPYIKEVSSNGKTRGVMSSLFGQYEFDAYSHHHHWGFDSWEFEHDPHFVESVILEAEGSYDPVEVQKNKKKLRDEVTKHNKDNKLKTSDIADVEAVFAAMQPGEVYWFSIKNFMTVLSTQVVAIKTGLRGKAATKNITQIEVQLSSNGKTERYSPNQFQYRNLYKAQPRSYRELSDTI